MQGKPLKNIYYCIKKSRVAKKPGIMEFDKF